MVNIKVLPCKDCENYKGVKQPDGTEKTEYVHCHVANGNNAINLLKNKNGKFVCNKLVPVENARGDD